MSGFISSLINVVSYKLPTLRASSKHLEYTLPLKHLCKHIFRQTICYTYTHIHIHIYNVCMHVLMNDRMNELSGVEWSEVEWSGVEWNE